MNVSLRFLSSTLVCVLAGCTAPGGGKSGMDPEAQLERRAMERWSLLIDGKHDQAYAYLSPGYRASRSLEDYQRLLGARAAVTWLSANWHGADCDQPDSCRVSVDTSYRVMVPQAGDISSVHRSSERWIRTGGEWYHLPAE